MKSTKIVGTGSYLPPRVLTNFDLEKMVDTSDEWIRARTGIRERRIADPGVASSDLGVEAARRALESAGISPEELDLIIVSTVTPDMFFPSTACIIQDKIGAKKAAAFDLSAACSGFIYGLAVARGLIAQGGFRNVLLVATETLSKITDWTDRSTCVLLGDGAGAVVLQPAEEGEGVLSFYLGADGSSGRLLYIPGGGSLHPPTPETVEKGMHYLKMRGNELFKIAVKILVKSAEEALCRCHMDKKDIDLLIVHQANIRIIQASAKRLSLPPEKVFINIDRYGNTSAATIPIALDEAVRTGGVKKGDIILLDAFGGGLTWGACVLKW